MKKRKFWTILLGVLVVVIVLGAIGFSFYRHWAWGGRYGAWGKMPHTGWQMPHNSTEDMPCEEGDRAASEGYGSMHHRGFRGCGMGRMPHMHSIPGMYRGWGYRGHSPLTNLLLLILVIMGVLHFTRYRRYHKTWHHRPMHGYHGQHNADCTCGDSDASDKADKTPDVDENQPKGE
jgi:hypothetical protein